MTDDHYKVLQVDPEADPEVIQAAYRRLALKWHPDVAAGAEAAARMAAINRAWDVVGDSHRRAAYDRERGAAGTSSSGPATPARSTAAATPPSGASPARDAETVSRDWTAGRSSVGGGYDASRMRRSEGLGAAGRPPGNPAGRVLNFGRYAGWSLGEIGRRDIEYLEWLDRVPIGRLYRDEIDAILRRSGRRLSAEGEALERRGLFRRR